MEDDWHESQYLFKSQWHWNGKVILMKFSVLAALEIVILTTFTTASDTNFIEMMMILF